MGRVLFRGGRAVLPSGTEEVNVLVDGGRIVGVGVDANTPADEIVDARGLVLLPGVVDDQVHFREPGLTHKEDLVHATRACAKGGVTSFLEMPNTNPTTTTVARLHDKLALAQGRCTVNYGFYMGATPGNVEELRVADRTPGIKIFIGSSTGELLVDDQDALERIFAETTLPICAHCEDESTIRANAAAIGTPASVADHSSIRDEQAAVIATRRAFDLAARHNHRFHLLHVSTAAEAEMLRGRPRGVTAEVCPHHLLFCIDDYERLGSLVQMNPSIKTRADNEGLWRALAEGIIEVVATDHAPHTREEKSRPYPESPSGLPAIENSLVLMLDAVNAGRLTLQRLVEAMCDAPARVWGIVGKGRITEGYDADLVLVDLEREQTIRDEEQLAKCGWTPWNGTTVRGAVVQTWLGGVCVYKDSRVVLEGTGGELVFDHARGGFAATPDGIGTA